MSHDTDPALSSSASSSATIAHHAKDIKHQLSAGTASSSLLNPLPSDNSGHSLAAIVGIDKDNEDAEAYTNEETSTTAGLKEPGSPSSSSSPSTASLILKNTHRTKLTTQDIRLILHLIIQIKPFKYVGDRSLSQTKKWELIQLRYSELKRQQLQLSHHIHGDQESQSIVVPTVRTLQRQLATAIRKASGKRQAKKLEGIVEDIHDKNEDDEYYLFNHLNSSSSLSELEAALLDLNDLSDKLKTGKLTNTSHILQARGEPVGQRGAANITELSSSIKSLINKASSTPIGVSSMTTALQALAEVKQEIGTLYPPDNYGDTNIAQSLQVFEDFLQKSSQFQSQIYQENHVLYGEIDKLIKSHYEKLDTISKEFTAHTNVVGDRLIDLLVEKTQSSGQIEKDGQDKIIEKLSAFRDILQK